MRKDGSFYATSKTADSGPRPKQLVTLTLFLLAGLLVLGLGWIAPLLEVWGARHWVETRCEVISAEIESTYRDNSYSYKAQIRFRYEFEGRQYQGHRFSFDESWTTERAQREIVSAYPEGTVTPCYVNPQFPPEAVIEKDFVVSWFFFFFPMLFILVGGVGLAVEIRR